MLWFSSVDHARRRYRATTIRGMFENAFARSVKRQENRRLASAGSQYLAHLKLRGIVVNLRVRWSVLATAVLSSTLAFGAGSVSSAQVVGVRVDSSGKGLVIFDRPLGGAPASCTIPYYANSLAFNLNTNAGKAILALALAAKASGDPVTVHGLGTCATYGHSVEDWDYGQTE